MLAASSKVIMEDEIQVKRLEAHKKTRLCKFFAMGACTRGSSCAFAHGSDQLRDQPNFSKTRLCADFVERGRCSRGEACTFAHGKHELRPGSAAKLGRPGRDMPKAPQPEDEEVNANATLRALQTLRMQHSLHEQAALKLMFCSAGTWPSQQCGSKVAESSPCGQPSFSRQTTWEGLESHPSGFSRESSAASCTSDVANVLAAPKDIQVLVKNTFIEVKEDADEEAAPIRRTSSLPHLHGPE